MSRAADAARPVRRSLRDDRGASALELSLVAPGVVFFLFFAIQAGLYFYGQAVAQQAAREGVSKLRLAQTVDVCQDIRAQVEQSVEAYSTIVGRETLLDPKATVRCRPDLSGTDVQDANKVSVTVEGRVLTLVPGLSFRTTQVVVGEIERFEGNAP